MQSYSDGLVSVFKNIECLKLVNIFKIPKALSNHRDDWYYLLRWTVVLQAVAHVTMNFTK